MILELISDSSLFPRALIDEPQHTYWNQEFSIRPRAESGTPGSMKSSSHSDLVFSCGARLKCKDVVHNCHSDICMVRSTLAESGIT